MSWNVRAGETPRERARRESVAGLFSERGREGGLVCCFLGEEG